jgi:hypothetical protein
MFIAIEQYEDGEINTVKAFKNRNDAEQFLKTRWEDVNEVPFYLDGLQEDGMVTSEYGANYSVYEVEIS